MTKQEVRQMLEAVYSKDDYDFLFKKASDDQFFFTLIWEISQEVDEKDSWRYLWILDHATQNSNANLLPIVNDLYKMALTTNNESVIRQTMKLVLRCPVNEEYAGELLDRCVKWMFEPKAKISSQCLGLEFFFKCCQLYPDMKPELQAYIEEISSRTNSAGYKARLKQISEQLQ